MLTRAPDARGGATEFEVCPPGFPFCFDLIFPCYALIFLFWNKNVSFTSLESEAGNFAFDFVEAHSYKSGLTLRSDFGLLNDEIVEISRHGGIHLCCNCPPGQQLPSWVGSAVHSCKRATPSGLVDCCTLLRRVGRLRRPESEDPPSLPRLFCAILP